MNNPVGGAGRPGPGRPAGGSRYIGHIHDRVAGRERRPGPAGAPVLKAAPPAPATAGRGAGVSPAAAAPDPTRAANRRNLLVTSVPLLLVAALCLFAVVKRTAIDPLTDRRFGNMSRSEARLLAGALCSRLTGEQARAVDVSQQAAFSCRRRAVVREWDVVCDTADGQYLLRINADSGRVYAVNRLLRGRPGALAIGAPAGHERMSAAAPPADEAEEERRMRAGYAPVAGPARLTREEAEARAREYLHLLGVPAQGLRRMDDAAAPLPVDGAGAAEPGIDAGAGYAPVPDSLWNFTYRRHVPGLGDRLLKVSVNGRSGELEHVWNPVSAL